MRRQVHKEIVARSIRVFRFLRDARDISASIMKVHSFNAARAKRIRKGTGAIENAKAYVGDCEYR